MKKLISIFIIFVVTSKHSFAAPPAGTNIPSYPNISLPDDLAMFILARTNVAGGPTNNNHQIGQLFTRITNNVNSLNLWTNDAGVVIRPLSNAPVQVYRSVLIGTNAYQLISSDWGFGPTNGVVIGSDMTKGDPEIIGTSHILRGQGNFTFATIQEYAQTNQIRHDLQIENDDMGVLADISSVIDTNFVSFVSRYGTPSALAQMFALNPSVSTATNPYIFRATARGSGSLFVVKNNHTNEFEVDYAGNSTNLGKTASTMGFASYSTIATNQIPTTGWTNNEIINVTVYTTATAISFTINNRAGTVLYTSPTLTATIPINLQPGWSVRAASGLTGTVLPF